jgi:hypothetical protein
VFVGFLHPSKPAVRIFDYLPSYEMIATGRYSLWPLSALLRGVLRHFDLPDLYRLLGSRLSRRQPWGLTMKPEVSSLRSHR